MCSIIARGSLKEPVAPSGTNMSPEQLQIVRQQTAIDSLEEKNEHYITMATTIIFNFSYKYISCLPIIPYF